MPIPHSSRFEDACVAGVNHPIVLAEVLDRYGNVVFELSPDGGGTRRDRGSSIRGTCSLMCHGKISSLVPPGVNPEILKPWGTEVRILKGFEYNDGSQELLSKGIFRLITVNTNYNSDEGVGVLMSGKDRCEKINRQLIESQDVGNHHNYGFTISILTQLAWRGASKTPSSPPLRFVPTAFTGSAQHFEAKTNALDECIKMATACGLEYYADYSGAIALDELPDINSQPVWEFVDGQNDTVIEVGQEFSSDQTKNYWTVNAVGPGMEDKGVFGVVFVDDPDSSLNVDGDYGTNPDWIDSQYANSKAACEAEGRAERARVLRGTDTMTIRTRSIPFLLEGDVVSVTKEAIDVFDRPFVIVDIDDPLTVQDAMTVTVGRG